ncbi:glycyl radical protein [Clostridium gasigenes]|uniref:glycyl radical protein n=1 Tax=Clostridium gasigenes TaxID=94869 RepID=UPI001C0C8B8D|nr:glycyl radical protein [Clostridium gasigenes]MBU3107008.1 glycyl radical protein [Clostridium gasigenes]
METLKRNFLSRGFKNSTERVSKLKEEILSAQPCVEVERARLITESFKETEDQPIIIRKAKALEKILNEIPVVIRDGELIVGTLSKNPRSAQVFPEFSNKWLVSEFDRIGKRTSDKYEISEDVKSELVELFKYWDGKTVSELAKAYMPQETQDAMSTNVFTCGNYYFNGLGHYVVDYEKVIKNGVKGIVEEVQNKINNSNKADPEFIKNREFWESIIISCNAAINFAKRYSKLALNMAEDENNSTRKKELINISEICDRALENGSDTFYEAVQSFWFIQVIISLESNGHAISPGRFDQYTYEYFRKDIDSGNIDMLEAQELIDCLWVKFNDITKIRDEVVTKAFSGYGMFQNLIVGGQTADGNDATNELSYMCIEATGNLKLPQPSLSARIWSKTPEEFLLRCCELVRLGLGFPALYNDEVIIPSLLNRGVTLEDSRNYSIVGCVEPQCGGKTDGWYDAAFFNLAKVLEMTINNGKFNEKQIGPKTGEFTSFKNLDEFIKAYKEQTQYFVSQMVCADNCVDMAHRERAPLPFVSCMMDDCIERGKSIQDGGAHYRYSGPLGVGIANIGDSFMAIKKLVFEDKKITLNDLKDALLTNFGQDEKCDEFKRNKFNEIKNILIHKAPKFGNDLDEVDELTREGALIYCKEVEKHTNVRGGKFLPGLYPVSNNVHLGSQVGATPDGRSANQPLADGVSPNRGMDTNGPTAAANSVAKLDHFIAASGTLFNQKFNPSSLKNDNGLKNLASLIRGYFDEKGMHVQFNVIDKAVLIEAQKHPEQYRDLVIRVAGYSAQFICLDKSIQDDIIARTEQAF